MTSYRTGENPWTEDQTRRMLTLWSRGLAKSQIGDALGCSREAVVGKLWRLRKNGVKVLLRK